MEDSCFPRAGRYNQEGRTVAKRAKRRGGKNAQRRDADAGFVWKGRLNFYHLDNTVDNLQIFCYKHAVLLK